ncbi:MAG: nuclear transport factor 2 family protein [Rhodothermia bacterium]|nr:MAG: nuclear transport factor 2 family protein [Rhodothermia bacterium]
MKRSLRNLLCITLFAGTIASVNAQALDGDEAAINHQLDELHRLASEANYDQYFALYRDDAVFLGTDVTERWPIAEFREYAKSRFDAGLGWTYHMTSRHIYVSDSGTTAWFDELLENETLGTTRGSGVLVKEKDEWKISQYNLTIPVPNQLAREFVARIRELEDER